MKKIALASVAIVASLGTTIAADLPIKKSVPAAIPTFSWSGIYAGINIGYGFGNNSVEQGSMVENNGVFIAKWSKNQNLAGVIGGGQVGYNLQINQWLVFGGEADIQASDMNSKRWYQTTGIGYPGDRLSINSTNALDWFGTLRGRVGVVLPNYSNVLLYGTGGLAYGYVNNTVGIADIWWYNGQARGYSGSGTYGNTNLGWTAGGGAEWSPSALTAWSVKFEYLYTNLGLANQTIYSSYSFDTGYSFIANHNTQMQFSTIKAGLNWHFNPFVGEPIVAK